MIRKDEQAMSFTDIQNSLYNAIVQGLGLSSDSFQLIQPSPPLIPGSDTVLWNYLNNIPPYSLTQNSLLSGGAQLFTNYKGLMDALEPLEDVNVSNDVGPDVYAAFIAYVDTLSPPPNPSVYPDLFFNWAFLNAPDVADIGASDYATILLDPILTAKTALVPYLPGLGPHPTPGSPPKPRTRTYPRPGQAARIPASSACGAGTTHRPPSAHSSPVPASNSPRHSDMSSISRQTPEPGIPLQRSRWLTPTRAARRGIQASTTTTGTPPSALTATSRE
jgi:hypothetical protein